MLSVTSGVIFCAGKLLRQSSCRKKRGPSGLRSEGAERLIDTPPIERITVQLSVIHWNDSRHTHKFRSCDRSEWVAAFECTEFVGGTSQHSTRQLSREVCVHVDLALDQLIVFTIAVAHIFHRRFGRTFERINPWRPHAFDMDAKPERHRVYDSGINRPDRWVRREAIGRVGAAQQIFQR